MMISVAIRLATSPARCPPMPSANAKTPPSASYTMLSSLNCRTLPVSVTPAISMKLLNIDRDFQLMRNKGNCRSVFRMRLEWPKISHAGERRAN